MSVCLSVLIRQERPSGPLVRMLEEHLLGVSHCPGAAHVSARESEGTGGGGSASSPRPRGEVMSCFYVDP